MLKIGETGRERVGMGEEEKVDEARKAYAENDSDSAMLFAVNLLRMSLGKKKDEIKDSGEEIKKILEKYTTKEIEMVYASSLLFLISKQEDDERKDSINSLTEIAKDKIRLDVIKIYKILGNYPQFNFIFEDFNIDAKEPIEIKLNEIFEQLNVCKIEERADIKIELIFLLFNVMDLKKMALVNPKGLEICHYTRLKSIKYILGTDVKEGGGTKETKFRLNNSEYMNDPSEGKTFIKLLEKQLVEGETSEVLTNVLDRCYPSGCQEDNVREEVINSNIYLSSFSESIDSLPMWSQYGDDGKGCCLVMEDGIFDKKENSDYDINAIHNGMSLLGATETGEKYVLYHVTYVENNALNAKEEQDKLKLIEKIAESLIKIEDNIQKLTNEKLKGEIDEFITATLDQVRFLFKDKTYQHEKELRLVKFSEEPCLDNNDNLIVPKLYIEMEKEIKYKEIILGPKIPQPSEIAPYIYSTKKIKKVSRSAIRYR